MENKLLIGTSIALLLGVGALTMDSTVEKVLVGKPVLDSKIDSAIIAKQEQVILQEGMYEQKSIQGEDGVKRTIVPYVSPDGKKGYTIQYEKVETTTDNNGSTTEMIYRQQIDYGHEGRTQLW
jgi:hypothetical protein